MFLSLHSRASHLFEPNQQKDADTFRRPVKEHTELEEELHEKAHIDYDRVAIVSISAD